MSRKRKAIIATMKGQPTIHEVFLRRERAVQEEREMAAIRKEQECEEKATKLRRDVRRIEAALESAQRGSLALPTLVMGA